MLDTQLNSIQTELGYMRGILEGLDKAITERGTRLDRMDRDIGKLKTKVNYGTGFAAAVGLGAGYLAKHALAALAILTLLAEPAHAQSAGPAVIFSDRRAPEPAAPHIERVSPRACQAESDTREHPFYLPCSSNEAREVFFQVRARL